ncbi:MAG: multicomponent Na+:H+ antiporter subunit [Thermosediminibacterales bacterium]|nr:multicomponent Na+:H+ antiporter subunit [Thermosediminibacterales bacterium]
MKKSRFKKQNILKKYLFGFLLLVFWFFVSGSLDFQHLLVGLISVLGIILFSYDLINDIDLRFLNFKSLILLLKYFITLIVEIVKANIQVAIIVLSPRLNISPGIIKFNTKIKNDFLKMMFANSITLTPGTLTINIEDDECTVHFLTKKHAESVSNWEIEKQLKKLEEI